MPSEAAGRKLESIGIIGAGLAGTSLALALQQRSITCRIWEARDPDAPELSSGVILTPNGLATLDALGVLPRIADRCYKAEYRTYKNSEDKTTKKTLIAHESLYGYKNHRIWRRWLLDEMKLMLVEKNVPITYNSRFEGIVRDTGDDDVRFLINGKEQQCSLLVGADGIYSTLRKHLSDVTPEYTGVLGVISHIKRDAVSWPYPEFERSCTIQGPAGAIFMIPEVVDASEIMVGMQVSYPDQSRSEWAAMAKDPDRMAAFFKRNYDQWHGTARSIIDAVCDQKDTLYLWPFLRMPKLERWFSPSGRVLLVGDAAHALPPSSGQGVNQALEDIHCLCMLLDARVELLKALGFWQSMRQARIDAVFEWATNTTNVQRMSDSERARVLKERKASEQKDENDPDDMSWLYKLKIDEEIRSLLNSDRAAQANGVGTT